MPAEEGTRTDRVCGNLKYSGRGVTVLVYIEGNDEKGIHGRFRNFYLDEPVKFSNAGDLVLKLDRLCDRLDSPHAKPSARFLISQTEACCSDCGKGIPGTKLVQITVQQRAGGDMRGIMRSYAPERGYVGFRSAMELMKLLNLIEVENVSLRGRAQFVLEGQSCARPLKKLHADKTV